MSWPGLIHSSSKFVGTSPNDFKIVASLKFPMFGSPLRLNASAPALVPATSTRPAGSRPLRWASLGLRRALRRLPSSQTAACLIPVSGYGGIERGIDYYLIGGVTLRRLVTSLAHHPGSRICVSLQDVNRRIEGEMAVSLEECQKHTNWSRCF